ncbi:MAG TPA: thiamine pyrophosphate-dependent enzyme [Candidatus Hydrogenedentes bacterium]|nr:thiamine pyrophosphate-dependent enzyme [Candidatus Hydrogenedentota bacterium]
MSKVIFERPRYLCDKVTHYCAGCTHGTAHRLVAEAIEHFGVGEKAVAVAPAGCSVMLYKYFDVDSVEAPHGRALAVGTGIKRARPDLFVFTYQGDGDLASIGLCETMHAANRGEGITVIYVNNAVYGMTGGQMAPTTLLGQRTTTTPAGRKHDNEGHPLKMAEMMATLEGVLYSERVALYDPKQIRRARKAIFHAFEVQTKHNGFGFVEVLSACPTNLHLSPVQSQKWVENEMCAAFPLGLYKDVTAKPPELPAATPEAEVNGVSQGTCHAV